MVLAREQVGFELRRDALHVGVRAQRAEHAVLHHAPHPAAQLLAAALGEQAPLASACARYSPIVSHTSSTPSPESALIISTGGAQLARAPSALPRSTRSALM